MAADAPGGTPAWTLPDRRKDHTTRSIRDIHDRLDRGEERMNRQDRAIKENTDITKAIKDDTAEIVDFAQSVKGTIKVFNMLGKLAKPLTYIVMFATAVAGAFTAIKSGSKFP